MITPTLRSCVLLCVAMLPTSAQRITVNPAKMPRLGTVDERFQSYNVEMVEVTGGRFWKPYAAAGSSAVGGGGSMGTADGAASAGGEGATGGGETGGGTTGAAIPLSVRCESRSMRLRPIPDPRTLPPPNMLVYHVSTAYYHARTSTMLNLATVPGAGLPDLRIERPLPVGLQAYQTLRHAVVTLQLRPGQPLSEQGVAQQLKISRTPVREAFGKLADAGLFEVLPQRGTFVRRISAKAVKDARFANADAQGDLNASWSTGPGEGFGHGGRLPGQFELNGRIVKGEAVQVPRYLPLHLAGTRGYLGRAIRGGTVRDASFRVKGDLFDFPYNAARSAKEGEFRIAGRVEGATFDYVPSEPAVNDKPAWTSPWPAFTQVAGELVIDRTVLEIRDARAQLGGVSLSQVNGGFRSLIDKPVLALDGVARGPLADMLRFVNATPVGQWTGGALARASATGNANCRHNKNSCHAAAVCSTALVAW